MLEPPHLESSVNAQFGFEPFSTTAWQGCSGAASWEDQGDLLVGDEFDMNAIPPIELGIPGGTDHASPLSSASSPFDVAYTPGTYDVSPAYSPEAAHSPETFEQLFNFDGMLPGISAQQPQHGY